MIKIPGVPPKRKEQSIIGVFSARVISLLSLDIEPGTPIFISDTNREHIREHHPDAYMLYFDQISDIISAPDYVGIGGVQISSIEFIKRFEVNNELVNVAVRSTKSGIHFARSMFIIDEMQLQGYLKKGTIKKLTSNCKYSKMKPQGNDI